ncbi:MarR family winged helix-turn-helix transcriptional regulator [Trichloromonas sp.]|uniref:MarR family winged helix-turn-helix transcriptional regulator n=1 Tax=Trichloromonas sp. TaxID=3069249 RepID=UPI002A46B536|nr:MarR family transcriptional regulator [Trichloromonas sp.]
MEIRQGLQDTGLTEENHAGEVIPLHESPTIPDSQYDLRILQSLRRIIRAIEIHSHKLAHSYGITGPQLSCLLAIRDQGKLTAARLAKIVYLSPSTLVGILDRLEEKGLVSRSRSPRDRRQVLIEATPSGAALAADAPSLLQDTLRDSLAALSELERVSISLSLEKVVDLMEARNISAAPVLETGPLNPPAGEP